MIGRKKYLERQRRYNTSAKGRARCARYRREHPERLAETRARDNAARIFVGSYFVGREGKFPYPREVVEQHLGQMYDDFRNKQAEETAAFREALVLEPQRELTAGDPPDGAFGGLVVQAGNQDYSESVAAHSPRPSPAGSG